MGVVFQSWMGQRILDKSCKKGNNFEQLLNIKKFIFSILVLLSVA
jgi:hypothetical protein